MNTLNGYIEVKIPGATLFLTEKEYTRGLSRAKRGKRQREAEERGERKIKEYVAKKERRKQGF